MSQPLETWFDGSAVVDRNGRPLPVFRGEHAEGPAQLRTLLASFTFSDAEVASLYAMQPNDSSMEAESPRIYPVYLRIRRPFRGNDYGDPFIDLSEIERLFGKEEAIRLALKFEDQIMNTGYWQETWYGDFWTVKDMVEAHPDRLGDLYFNLFYLLDDPEEVERLRQAGYDGAIYDGSGESSGSTEYRVFSPEQVWSIPAGQPFH